MRRHLLTFVAGVLGVLLLAGAAAVLVVSGEIHRQSIVDEADQPADVIIVLGAAEYRGRPSPVLEARLNHALYLYLERLAPRILTTGGAGGDPLFTEGGVGRAYLAAHGVPPEDIIVENKGESTVESVVAVAEIMQRMDLLFLRGRQRNGIECGCRHEAPPCCSHKRIIRNKRNIRKRRRFVGMWSGRKRVDYMR